MLNSPRRVRHALREEKVRVDVASVSQLRRLGRFIAPYKWYLAAAMVGTLFATLLGLVFPQIMGQLVDSALSDPDGDTSELNRITILLLAVFLGQALFNVVRIYFTNVMGEGIVADLRTATYTNLMTLPVKFFDSRKTGEITSRLTSDVAVIQATASSALAQALAQTVTLVGGVVLMFVASVQLSLIVLSFLPIAIIASALFGRRLRKVSTAFQDKVAEANSYADETISANRVVKWFSAEQIEINRYTRAVGASYEVAKKRARLMSIFSPTVTFVAFGTLSLVLWIGGRQVISGSMSAGDLVTFLLYTVTVASAIGTFTGLYGQLQQALGASARVFELLDEKSDIAEPVDPVVVDVIEGRVTFDNVWFSYADRSMDVIQGISIDARPGERIALVGPSGAGKSTLIQLIPRFFDPVEGRLLIDGIDLKDLRVSDVRRPMAAVPQETQLFSGTITENLRVGNPDASDEDIRRAGAAANADEFIMGFPEGYETIVGERGVKLSGGQRQRVAIARALLKDPRILILDEATSSLDSESEALVQEALERLMEGRTTFVIAHRLSTVRNADRLVVIDGGVIVQEGNHDELIVSGGLYADLYARQFEDVEPLH